MNRIDIANVYQNSMYGKTAQTGKNDKTVKAESKKQVQENSALKNGQVSLSENAKKLLKELKDKYGNMDFIVADYKSDAEAANYLSRGNNEYSVLFTPRELEEMAADVNKKQEKLTSLDEAIVKLDFVKQNMGEKADEITRLGIAFGQDGEISFFAELQKTNESQRERIEKKREEKKVQEKEDSAKEVKEKRETEKYEIVGKKGHKKTIVYGSDAEELMNQIAKVDWETIEEAPTAVSGMKFNFTV